jgi:hypothetical protein
LLQAFTELKKECMNRTFGVKSNWRILQYVISPLVNMTRFYRSHKNIKNSNNKLEFKIIFNNSNIIPSINSKYSNSIKIRPYIIQTTIGRYRDE